MNARTRWHRGLAATASAFAAAVPALDAHAAFPDLAALAGSTDSAYGVFAIAIAVVIVLLLWYAVDDGAPDERPVKSGRKQTGRTVFDSRPVPSNESDRPAA